MHACMHVCMYVCIMNQKNTKTINVYTINSEQYIYIYLIQSQTNTYINTYITVQAQQTKNSMKTKEDIKFELLLFATINNPYIHTHTHTHT